MLSAKRCAGAAGGALLLLTACGETSTPPAEPGANEADWITLFDGTWGSELEVWISREGVFDVEDQEIFTLTDDGLIQIYGKTPALIEDALLMTKAPHENYHFRVEYMWGEEQFNRRAQPLNSGILYHVFGGPNADDPADETILRMGSSSNYGVPVGGPPFADGPREPGSYGGWTRSVEYQMRLGQAGVSRLIGTQAISSINTDGDYAPLSEDADLVARGAVNGPPYGFTIAKPFDTETGWNVAEIVVTGAKARHLINGQEVLVQHDLRAFDPGTRTLVPLTSGRVGVQAEGAELYVRSIMLKPL